MKKITLSFLLFFIVAVTFASNTLNLSVKGMHCGGCEAKFKSKVEAINGVTKVIDVSATNSTASLEYNPSVTSEEKIIKQLVDASGYTISKVNSGSSSSTTTKSCCKSGQTACTKSATTSTCTKPNTTSTCQKTGTTSSKSCKKSKSKK